jgi:hypothetical protein
LIEVSDASAKSLFNSIKLLLDSNNIPYNNLIGFGVDNASVMIGNLGEVKAKLQEIPPHIKDVGVVRMWVSFTSPVC